ncbi:hypothetical protein GGI12_005804, partial [Dipsacomyces acuminosporus]
TFKEHYGTITDDNVLITNVHVKNKNNVPVPVRTIAFTCGNVNFHMGTTYPDSAHSQRGGPLSVQRFKCILSEAGNENTGGSSSNGSGNGGVDPSTAYSRRTTSQACIVLNSVDPNDAGSDVGPKIIFSTDSINRILDVDSSDLHGLPFLSLVDAESSEKAAEFLQKALHSSELVLEQLGLLVSPLEESHLASPRSVAVEFMAMGSDDGIIMLCQLSRPKLGGNDADGRYMPLEDIISSDPETSDFPDAWNIMG